MDGIKVREVSGDQEKSSQQIEQELLAKHEQQTEGTEKPHDENVEVVIEGATNDQPITEVGVETKNELGDSDVLSYIKDRYNKDINSIDDLLTQRENNEDLPEDVSAFLKYKQDTGRGLTDFMRMNQDLDELEPDKLLADYWSETKTHLDNDDVKFELNNRFGYDEDLDEEADVRKIKIAKKEELVKAKEYFNKQKEQYGAPLESSGSQATEEERKNFEAYKEHAQKEGDIQEHNKKRQEFFLEKTNELFSDDFKGFDFTVGEKQMVFKPGTPEQLKKSQSDVTNFINTHVNEDGYVKDANAYHKSLAVAMNPEAFAKFFYEQGMSDAIGDVTRESKNVDMPVRKSPQSASKGGLTVRAIETTHGSGLRIKSRK
jgi:hypothetical protein